MDHSAPCFRRMVGLCLGVLILSLSARAQSGPRASGDEVSAALVDTPKIPAGPFAPSWDSLQAHYQTPDWFRDAKFGIFIHFGLYSVPAHQSEWYEKYMYGSNAAIMQWHTEKYGPPEKFGYKDFMPLFATKFDADQWAELFKKAGAKYVVPTAEHHDGFSLWDSAINKFNAKAMGPKRDIIGELAAAVRKQGLKFGVSNHSIEHYTFITGSVSATQLADLKAKHADLFDPQWADFYWVDGQNSARLVQFLHEWVTKNYELIDKYQPDLLWFDNGVNGRVFDPLKLAVAAYYYNRAAQWGKAVSLSTKDSAYLAGSIEDFERESRAPTELTDYAWETDDPIGEKFGYVEGMKLSNAAGIVHNLITNVSHNGNLLLNISPRGDGTIPQEQQDILLAVGKWLDVNGEAIYGTRPWAISGEGGDIHFTTKPGALYVIINNARAGDQIKVASLPAGYPPQGKIEKVELLGGTGSLPFTQDAGGLQTQLPAELPSDYAAVLKISMHFPSQ